MQTATLAEYLLERQPEPIRRRLLSGDGAGAGFGFKAGTIVTIGQVGRFPLDDLMAAGRCVLADLGEQRLASLDGAEAFLLRGQDGLVIETRGTRGAAVKVRLGGLAILSPNAGERSAGLDSLLRRTGPAAPDFTDLKHAAADRDLSDEEAAVILKEAWNGVAALQARTRSVLESGRVAVAEIIPGTLGYYDRFCGPDPGDTEPEAYLGSALPAYRRALLGRDLPKGLEICLLGGFRDDLSPAAWLTEVSDDALWTALERAAPRRDPYSLLGALDVALARQHDPRYRSLAEGAVEALARDTFLRPDGIDAYGLMSILAPAVFDRVTMLEGGERRPPFWRRMCAWMQAGLLARMSLPLELDLAKLRRWAAEGATAAGALARLLDLRREPMFRAAEMSADAFRGEILGRLLLLRSRHEAAGRTMPNADALDAAVERFSESGLAYGLFAPGPLEGHRRPVRPPPDGAAEVMIATFDRRPTETSAWLRLSHLSQLFAYDESLMGRARQTVRDLAPGADQAERDDYHLRVEQAGLLAAARRDVPLAREIGATLVRHASSIGGDGETWPILVGLLLAGAAFEDEQAWSTWLDGQLVEVAARLPAGAAVRRFAAHLQELRRALPAHLPVHARAAALCAAAPEAPMFSPLVAEAPRRLDDD